MNHLSHQQSQSLAQLLTYFFNMIPQNHDFAGLSET